ncbi:MAG: hypothetical protein KH074_00020 [Faecalibacterium prausnitzii]|nr:hypothetical protein [Faecalibacterium prausnitzii]
MLTTLAAPAFADIWHIEDGDITVKAGETGNDVTQKGTTTYGDTDTIITNSDKNTASSHTVTIEANDKDDKVEVTLKDVNIDTSSRNKAAVSVTGSGNTTIKLDGDNALKSDSSRSGIYGSGSLTITGGENDSLTAQGGSGANGIYSSGSLTISGGTVTANGGDGDNGIYSSGSVTISGGSTVTANGGNGTISGGNGIYSDSGDVTISGGSTVTAKGGDGGSFGGGSGISSFNRVAISGSTVTANGGDSSSNSGGYGISSLDVAISSGTVTANGGDSKDGSGGNGIYSSSGVAISGGAVTANGGDSKDGSGGNGIYSSSSVAISGGTVTATGGDSTGSDGSGGNGIYSRNGSIDLSGSLELTAKAGSPNGKALSRAGHELNLDDIKEKLDPGAKVTAINANGDSKQVSIPRPVEPEKPVIPEESSSSSDGGSATPSAPVSSLPGLTVTDKSGAVISYTSTQSGNTLTVCVGRLTASLHVSLAALRQLRAEGIETITFQTILCSTTLSVDELLAMGGEDAEAVLTHRSTDSSLTVG